MEVDVAELGVYWGKCLRVRVKIDLKKKLVRGERITIGVGGGGATVDSVQICMRGFRTFVIGVVC